MIPYDPRRPQDASRRGRLRERGFIRVHPSDEPRRGWLAVAIRLSRTAGGIVSPNSRWWPPRHEFSRAVILGLMCLAASGWLGACAHAPSPTTPARFDSLETRALAQALETRNDGLQTFKISGRLSLQQANRHIENERMVVAGMRPGHMRLVVQSITGLPAVSLACDAQWFYLLLHQEGDYHKKRLASGSLKQLLGIDIHCQDLFALLAGRVPLGAYASARKMDAMHGGEWGLEMRTPQLDLVERVYGEAASGNPLRFERLRSDGSLCFRVRFGPMVPEGGYQRPQRLEISTETSSMVLDIRHMITDEPLPEEVFRISAPS
jgi:hypothetical protein